MGVIKMCEKSKNIFMIIKIIISCIKEFLSGLLSSELYKNNKIQCNLLFLATLFSWIIPVLGLFIFFECKAAFSFKNQLKKEKLKAYVNGGVYDAFAKGFVNAIQNADMSSLKKLKSMEIEIESGSE